MQDLTGQVAIITGAGGGIGRAIAAKLAEQRMKIVLFGGRQLDKLAETRRLVEGQGAECLVLPGELTKVEGFEERLQQVRQRFGHLDVLINNAGVAQSEPVEKISEQSFDAIMGVNFRVPFFLTQKCLPLLRQSASATIINLASVVAHSGYPLQSVYTASKHALLGFTKSLAAECYQEGIRVHAIAPGGVYTDMIKISRPDLTSEGMILPEDIAELVLFFLSHRGNAVIDEIIVHRVNKQPFLV